MASLMSYTKHLQNTNPSQTPSRTEGGTKPKSFYKARITLIPKPDKDASRKLEANMLDEHRCKNLQ